MHIGKIQDDDSRPSILDESKTLFSRVWAVTVQGRVQLAVRWRLVRCLAEAARDCGVSPQPLQEKNRCQSSRKRGVSPVDLPEPCSHTSTAVTQRLLRCACLPCSTYRSGSLRALTGAHLYPRATPRNGVRNGLGERHQAEVRCVQLDLTGCLPNPMALRETVGFHA